MRLLFEDEEAAKQVASELDLDADEVSYLTGWSDSRAEEIAESDELEPEEVEEEEEDDESQSTLSNF